MAGSGGRARAPRERVLGRTALGTPIRLRTRGGPRLRPLVLVVAGQHGDEPEGPQALLDALAADRTEIASLGLGLAWIAEANPDGLARKTRENADGVDLNRDHLDLRTGETRAVHRAVEELRPDVVVDMHTYPSRRRAALRRGWVLDDDVLLATPTNPAARAGLSTRVAARLVPAVVRNLAREGITAGEYRLFQRSGRVRRSTLTTRDLRNGVALRHGTFTVLLEGRSPRPGEPAEERRRLVTAERRALVAVLRWVAAHREAVLAPPPAPTAGDRVPVAARWTPGRVAGRATVRALATGARRRVRIPDFHGRVRVERTVRLPDAYAVPRTRERLLAWLARQRFARRARTPGNAPSPGPSLRRYVIFPVDQRGGHALAVWLEPGSMFRSPAADGCGAGAADGDAVLRLEPVRETRPSGRRSRGPD